MTSLAGSSTHLSESTRLSEKRPALRVSFRPYFMSLVDFEVEEEIFRVPRIGFEKHSDNFMTIYNIPPERSEVEGEESNDPVLLDAKASDFEAFLKVLYPIGLTRSVSGLGIDLKQKEWRSVLILAHRWSFGTIRQLAISQLEYLGLDAVTRLELGRACEMKDWMFSALVALAMRETSLNTEEGERLGMGMVIRLNEVREKLSKMKRIGPGVAEECVADVFPELRHGDLELDDIPDHEPDPTQQKVIVMRGTRSRVTIVKTVPAPTRQPTAPAARRQSTMDSFAFQDRIELQQLHSPTGASNRSITSQKKKGLRFKKLKNIVPTLSG